MLSHMSWKFARHYRKRKSEENLYQKKIRESKEFKAEEMRELRQRWNEKSDYLVSRAYSGQPQPERVQTSLGESENSDNMSISTVFSIKDVRFLGWNSLDEV